MKNTQIVEQLTRIWKTYKPKQLAKTFAEYAINKGLKRFRYDFKDRSNTYIATSSCGGSSWNRASCYYFDNNSKYGDENLIITLRKKAGDYLIIERKGTRAFEIDDSGVRDFDESLMKEIIKEHSGLFKALGVESEVTK